MRFFPGYRCIADGLTLRLNHRSVGCERRVDSERSYTKKGYAMNKLLFAGVAAAAISVAGAASAQFLGTGANPLGPEYIITFAANNTISTALNPAYLGVDPGPYDTVEDTYFGVVNNSSRTISSFNLSSPTQTIAGFDGDGIGSAAYLNVTNAFDTSSGAYGGADAWFTNINAGLTALTVNFIGGIAPGSTGYFSLEEQVSISQLATPEASTWAMMMLGFAGLGFAGYRARNKALSVA
jgi:hypothetical protein